MKRIPVFIAVLSLLAIFFYGLHYQTAKTLVHISGIFALIFVLYSMFRRNKIGVEKSVTVFILLLASSSIIIWVEHILYKNKLSMWTYKDFFYPSLSMIFILLALPDINKYKKFFQMAILSVLSFMVISAFYQTYKYGMTYRVSGFLGLPIIFATNVAMLTSIALVIAYEWREKAVCALLACAISVMGFSAVGLTGSKGPLISLIVFTFVAGAWILFSERRYKIILVGLPIILMLSVAVIGQTSVSHRLLSSMMHYDKDLSNKKSSSGVRLEMWRGASLALYEHPWKGVGLGLHREYFQEKLKNNPEYIEPLAATFVHLHNDIVNYVVWFGIPLGLLFVSFLFWLLYVFYSKLKFGFFMQAGFSSTFIFFICGLTNSPMSRATSYTLMLLLAIICLASLPRNNTKRIN